MKKQIDVSVSVCANPLCREVLTAKTGRPQVCCTPKCLRDAKREAARIKRSIEEELDDAAAAKSAASKERCLMRVGQLSWKLRPYASVFVDSKDFADYIDVSQLLPGHRS